MKFEELFQLARAVSIPANPEGRQVTWCDNRKSLGLARQANGAYELFFRGDPLPVRSALVQRHVLHDRWRSSDGTEFTATRIALPDDSHYQAVAAFIAEEIFRNGLSESLDRAFAASEPIIEMALRRSALSDEAIIGLIGELWLLNLFFSQCDTSSDRVDAFQAWSGYQQRARDFHFGTTSIEVKTTRSPTSMHHIHSIAQTDPLKNEHGDETEQLYLVSIGLDTLDNDDNPDGALTLPLLVDHALSKLGRSRSSNDRTEFQELFLNRIEQYGGSGQGYNHDSMQKWPAYLAPFRLRFSRAYDMNDRSVLVLRRDHVEACAAVRGDSIQFEIELPDRVSGDANPEYDILAFTRRVFRAD